MECTRSFKNAKTQSIHFGERNLGRRWTSVKFLKGQFCLSGWLLYGSYLSLPYRLYYLVFICYLFLWWTYFWYVWWKDQSLWNLSWMFNIFIFIEENERHCKLLFISFSLSLYSSLRNCRKKILKQRGVENILIIWEKGTMNIRFTPSRFTYSNIGIESLLLPYHDDSLVVI